QLAIQSSSVAPGSHRRGSPVSQHLPSVQLPAPREDDKGPRQPADGVRPSSHLRPHLLTAGGGPVLLSHQSEPLWTIALLSSGAMLHRMCAELDAKIHR